MRQKLNMNAANTGGAWRHFATRRTPKGRSVWTPPQEGPAAVGQRGGCALGAGGGGAGRAGQRLRGNRAAVWGDEHVPKTDGGDGCQTAQTRSVPLSATPEMAGGELYAVSITPRRKNRGMLKMSAGTRF